ncbi:MAG: helicase HerA domain-containing protein, partial [Pirellula sp.]
MLPDYEKLGSFYLGKKYDLAERKLQPELVNYDSKDLVTHALCVGMTGSGKTGLCLSLLEEAALDGVPAICIDPKGDLGNLLLAFPNLAANDFQEWIEPAEETRQGKPLAEIAEETANRWRKGLADWDQPPERIQKYLDSVDITIYTPGSNIGVPMTVLKSFDAPPPAVLEDAETMREKVSSAASGLLTLLGIDADPLTSKEHILLSNIFYESWKNGNDLSLEELIRQIQSPPIKKIG